MCYTLQNKRKICILIIHPNVMETLQTIFSLLTNIASQLTSYIALSPLCIISSSLYSSVLGLPINQQTLLLLFSLLLLWGGAAREALRLFRIRVSKNMFFYEFLAMTALTSSALIGATYSILMRCNPQEETLAKLCTTIVIVYLAERRKNEEKAEDGTCGICLMGTHSQDCMVLPCGHRFHERCLWDWIYRRQVCPTCLRSLN